MTKNPFPRLLKLVLLTAALHGMAARAAPQEIQLDYYHSTLSQGLDDWNDTRLFWQRTDDEKNKWYADVQNWNRFGQSDTKLGVGRRFYMHDSLQFSTEVAFSTSHSLFPAYSLYGGLETKLTPQTILTAGLRYAHYRKQDPITLLINEPDNETFNSRIEYYFGDSMVSYSLFYTIMQAPGVSDSVASHSIKYLYSYQLRNNVFASLDSGGDIDYVPTTSLLSVSQIDSMSLGGTHWLSDKLAMIYTMSNHLVTVSGSGFSYQRNVFYLGLRKRTN